MIYVFQAGDEFFKLKVDRIEKKLEIACSRTNYRFIPTPFWKLFGDARPTMTGMKQPSEEESKREMAEAELLNDKDFEKKLVLDFIKIGYRLIKKCH